MRCEYKDDFKIDYSGSLHVTKGDGVEFSVSGNQIPANFKGDLDAAARHNDCHELRMAAKAVTSGINEEWNRE